MRKLLLIVVLLLVSSVVRAQETVTIQPPPPPPGDLIDVGGYKLHLYCVGEGSPTVILEPGFGRFSLNMRATQENLSGITRVCAYDHAGFGWSEPGTMPRTTQQLSDELSLLLENAGIEPPYLLVAHSLGGFVARLFAAENGENIAGVVLLDATPPPFLLDPINTETDNMLLNLLRGGLQIAQAGAWNQQTLGAVLQLTNDVPTDLQETFISVATQPAYFEAALSEWENRLASAQQVIDAGELGDIPLMVLVAGERLKLTGEADVLWVREQAAQAELSTESELSVVVGGNHDFYVTQPEVVVEAVQRMMEEE
jgi:pimeloyl-ACP methyl ester carboxylesterase